ncbi:hypothetical protein A2263_04620 [Candidatus Peregrinibacteria bacterium RIFOXYA2_FULL_33_21]|nr:MAG: hypothetical protein A2263_04620 [Candidatus Peregrinibacteria bacterium RIFOXYA2_FULL_33_21]
MEHLSGNTAEENVVFITQSSQHRSNEDIKAEWGLNSQDILDREINLKAKQIIALTLALYHKEGFKIKPDINPSVNTISNRDLFSKLVENFKAGETDKIYSLSDDELYSAIQGLISWIEGKLDAGGPFPSSIQDRACVMLEYAETAGFEQFTNWLASTLKHLAINEMPYLNELFN